MKRFTLWEEGQAPLPAVDLTGDVVIGGGPSAGLRVPAQVAKDAHVRIAGDQWIAIAPVAVSASRNGALADQRAGDGGRIDDGVVFALGNYRVRVEPAPTGAIAATPQRTESLARELVRNLLGTGGAPSFEVVRGPGAGARRELPPPEATIVIGRGDTATWVILDEDLSREHVEIRRSWDGVSIRDLGSKNGTLIDGARTTGETTLHDGAKLELGNTELVFFDPAERHLQGQAAPPPIPPPPKPAAAPAPLQAAPPPPSRTGFWIAAAIAGLASAGLVWVLAS